MQAARRKLVVCDGGAGRVSLQEYHAKPPRVTRSLPHDRTHATRMFETLTRESVALCVIPALYGGILAPQAVRGVWVVHLDAGRTDAACRAASARSHLRAKHLAPLLRPVSKGGAVRLCYFIERTAHTASAMEFGVPPDMVKYGRAYNVAHEIYVQFDLHFGNGCSDHMLFTASLDMRADFPEEECLSSRLTQGDTSVALELRAGMGHACSTLISTMAADDARSALSLRLCAGCGDCAGSRCGRCYLIRYCSRACQLEHWPAHRQACSALAHTARCLIFYADLALLTPDRRAVCAPRDV